MEYFIGIRKDKEFAKATIKFLETFTLYERMKPYIVTAEEAKKAGMDSCLISDLVIVFDDASIKQFTKTLDEMSQGVCDFRKGWDACKINNSKK